MKSQLTPSRIASLDPGDMLGKTLELPKQIERGLSLGNDFVRQAKLSMPPELDWYGLGGSAIVGDLVQGLQLSPNPVYVRRQPEGAPTRSRVVYSYSGNTAESLSAFDEGMKAGKVWITASSGGKLAAKAKTADIPHLMLPTGYPPRGAVGFGIGAFMALFAELSHQKVPWSARESDILIEDTDGYKILDSQRNPALHLAENLVDRTPVLYALDPCLGPSLVHRASAQFAENAKIWARGAVLPELAHNEVEAFPALAGLLPPPHVLFLGEWPFPDFPNPCAPIEALLSEYRIPFERIEFRTSDESPKSRVLAGLRTMLLIDTASVYLALILARDPTTIPTITRLKSLQEKT
jgi:glucose/mannose-6-phosphate isomerase